MTFKERNKLKRNLHKQMALLKVEKFNTTYERSKEIEKEIEKLWVQYRIVCSMSNKRKGE